MGGRPDRRRAHDVDVAVLELRCVEVEVLRTRLGVDVRTSRACVDAHPDAGVPPGRQRASVSSSTMGRSG